MTVKNVTISIILLVALLIVYLLVELAPIGSGYAARYICSHVFLAGRSAEDVYTNDVRPAHALMGFVGYDLDVAEKKVTAQTFSLFGSRTAVYRPGFGCTLLYDGQAAVVDEANKFKLLKSLVPKPKEDVPWPEGAALAPNAAGLNSKKLDKALAYAMAEPYPKKVRGTKAALVIYKGRLAGERYASGYGRHTPILGWSMTKTVTAMVIGILIGDGKLQVDQKPSVAEWTAGDPRRAIELRHLLQMESGLAFEEVYGPFADATYMLYDSFDMAGYGASKALEHKPGTFFYYSSGTTNILSRIVRQQTGGTAFTAADFVNRRLFAPVGIRSAVIETDPAGSFVGSSYMYASAQDWARLGQLLLQEGKWQDQQIVPRQFVQFMRTPGPSSHGAYGGQTWLNRGKGNPNTEPDRRLDRLPAGVFYFSGYNGQQVMVFPKQELVVVRLGVTPDRSAWSIEEFAFRVMQSLPTPGPDSPKAN